MEKYIVYFAEIENWKTSKDFTFEITVEARDEEGAKEKAISIFNHENPELKLENYTYGFAKN